MAKVISHADIQRALDASDYESNYQSAIFRLTREDVLTESFTKPDGRKIYGPCRVNFYRYVDGGVTVRVVEK